ncbi:hypothetical protein D3C87_2001710 [compost metagenome]
MAGLQHLCALIDHAADDAFRADPLPDQATRIERLDLTPLKPACGIAMEIPPRNAVLDHHHAAIGFQQAGNIFAGRGQLMPLERDDH